MQVGHAHHCVCAELLCLYSKIMSNEQSHPLNICRALGKLKVDVKTFINEGTSNKGLVPRNIF